MKDIKLIIAENISSLRRDRGMTQASLAEKLNYSDKAVSKWERGESVPDITVLIEISSLFGVTIDYLLSESHDSADSAPEVCVEPEESEVSHSKRKFINHMSITCMSVVLVWLLASFSFVMNDLISSAGGPFWLAFVYAVPASCIVWLIFNSLWFNRRRNFLIISVLMWTVLVSLFLTFLPLGINISKIFGLGVPGQVIIFLWSRLKRSGK